MGRLAISAGIAAALVVTAVALGAAGDVRIHRLHVPPPPTADDFGAQPPAPGTTTPTDPGPVPPAPPPQPPAPPAPPPPPPSSVVCTTGGGATPDATGTLEDYSLSLTATTFSSAGPLTFRGVNSGADSHTIAIKTPGAATKLCGTQTIQAGVADTFTVTNLTAGSYVIYCTIHPTAMHEDITVN
jgi:plastocyanin